MLDDIGLKDQPSARRCVRNGKFVALCGASTRWTARGGLADADRIIAAAGEGKRAVVVGSSFIGMEVAFSGSVAAVITGTGITVLVLGLVIGNGVQAWTLSLPISLAAGGALTAALAHRMLEQLRKPA